MKELDKYNPVAEVCRVEYDKEHDSIFLVFRIIDEKFKQKVKSDWLQDIDLKMINKKLYEFEGEE